MTDLMKAAEAWADLPVRERSDMLLGLRATSMQYAKSPLAVKRGDARVLEAAVRLLVAAGEAVEKERERRERERTLQTQPIAEIVVPAAATATEEDVVIEPAEEAPNTSSEAPDCDRSRDAAIIECARCGFADCREVQP